MRVQRHCSILDNVIILPGGVAVALRTLNPSTQVRILAGQPTQRGSLSPLGLQNVGHSAFKLHSNLQV